MRTISLRKKNQNLADRVDRPAYRRAADDALAVALPPGFGRRVIQPAVRVSAVRCVRRNVKSNLASVLWSRLPPDWRSSGGLLGIAQRVVGRSREGDE
jgi:hypothetical protein